MIIIIIIDRKILKNGEENRAMTYRDTKEAYIQQTGKIEYNKVY